jgi:putative ABC transport system permease protein
MNATKLAFKNIAYRPLVASLNVGLFALGIGMIVFLINLQNQLEEQFDKNLAGVQLIIGAKGSPLQLVLCNLFHLDSPTGNIPLSDAKSFMNPKHPWIERAVPLGLGDSYRGYRIVGTTTQFSDLYGLEFEQGNWWEHSKEAVLGALVAKQTGLKVGDSFVSNHGLLEEEAHSHEEDPIKVVGILKPSQTVADNLILTSLPTLWEVHGHDHAHDHPHKEGQANHHEEGHDHDHAHDHPHKEGQAHHHEEGHDHDHDHPHKEGQAHHHEEGTCHRVHLPTEGENAYLIQEGNLDKEITALLVRFKGTSIQSLNMQRNINENTQMQAASPAIELTRLFGLLGIGISTVQILGYVLLTVAGLGILLSLFNSMRERQQEILMMRVWGAGKAKIASTIVWEGVLQAIGGGVLGWILSRGGLVLFNQFLQSDYKYSISIQQVYAAEWVILGLAVVIGALGALLPAALTASKSLSEQIR